MSKKLKWIIEIEVDEFWVKDGFIMSPGVIERIKNEVVPWADSNEVNIKVISTPDQEEIRKIQGIDI